MAKRKRNANGESSAPAVALPSKKVKATAPETPQTTTTIQVIAGSYDRVLHGITATVSPSGETQFADTFLFDAHQSAIRCLAISQPSAPVPKQTQKVILASGSSDERINLYHLSAHAPTKVTVPAIESLNSKAVVESSQNRELGNLIHHSSSITALQFPTRGKLLSSADDSTIAVTRTRDWSLLSTIKAPIPKPVGRPSGDTAPTGGTPSGVNDFAVHPSMKLMISVGKGEKCMRLWNLVTGKKAGVLNFERGMLADVGEGRHTSGEGRKVAWGSTDAGEEFCVGFDRGALVFGMDSKPKCKIVPEPRSKIHQLCYVEVGDEQDTQVVAVSTDDGRILFYSTRKSDLVLAPAVESKETPLPAAKLVAQLGGKDAGTESWERSGKPSWRRKVELRTVDDQKKKVTPEVKKANQEKAETQAKFAWTAALATRIKDFTVLSAKNGASKDFFIPAASSDGTLRIWKLSADDLVPHNSSKAEQVGTLLGAYETPNRITCMQAFVMLPSLEGANDDDFEGFDEEDENPESSSSDSE
ncbi:hypothetical protein D0Z07_8933 [Hyphodiscus hymeniophilus]|uniref:WD40 repeat-like protein n=1 Tax=Hyphodiscus hymeniophilus TaxID=353542 RepID=A0A9P6SMX6_9HELO|nr:hypothetical protein D0Z07_8933 [Hyphodiscus hymeniophilus]